MVGSIGRSSVCFVSYSSNNLACSIACDVLRMALVDQVSWLRRGSLS